MARVLSIPQAVMDYRLVQAMNEIREDTGDVVDDVDDEVVVVLVMMMMMLIM